MSHSYLVSMHVLSRENASRFLTSRESGAALRRAEGESRSDRFMELCRTVIDKLSLPDTLRFLSDEYLDRQLIDRMEGDSHLYRPAEAGEWQFGSEYAYVHRQTLLEGTKLVTLRGDLEIMLRESMNQLAELELHDYLCSKSKLDLITLLKPCEHLNRSPYGDEGDTTEFFFTTLWTLRALMEDAIAGKYAVVFCNSHYRPVVRIEGAPI